MARLTAADLPRSDVAHLLRRTGFGARPEVVDDLTAIGYGAAVDQVLADLDATVDAGAEAVAPPTFDTAGYLAGIRGDEAAQRAAQAQAGEESRALVAWWVRRMAASDRPVREKLTFLWHDHVATSLAKVNVALDGFDTHAGQPEAHARLLGDLDAALGDLLDRVADQPVTVMVHTEFGRRVAPNAGQGTDHGQAGVVLLAGAVRAGHHGDPSPLEDLDDGDLRTTTDFRSVYGAVLEDVLGTPAADVVAGAPAPLELV